MEPERLGAPFDDPEFTFQVKWDGLRCIALVEGGAVRLFSRRERERTRRFPELAGLGGQVSARRAVLDGELIVAGPDGRPSFPRALERESAQHPARVAGLSQTLPASYLVFDLVELEGRDLCCLPLEQRLRLLGQVLGPGGPAVCVESFPGSGCALFAAVAAQGLEGIVAKRLDSPYLTGRRSGHWRKVKRRLRQQAVIGGYLTRDGRLTSLLVGAYDRLGRLSYLGRVGSGLSQEEARLLIKNLRPVPVAPFEPPPTPAAKSWPRPAPGRPVWVQPEVTLCVEFSEWTDELKLRAPVVAGFLAEPPKACRLP